MSSHQRLVCVAQGQRRSAVRTMNGREYFRKLAADEKLDRLNAAEVSELPPLELKKGPVESRLGGRIARDLKALTPEETAQQHAKADKLVNHPRRSFPAEEDDES